MGELNSWHGTEHTMQVATCATSATMMRSVYAGFMKSILTPEDRRELYNGVTNPREELLGDTSGASTWNPHNGNSVSESLRQLGRV